MSIREAVEDLNESIFLPAIQREFVWDTDQVIRLFDSVLRGYPIGSFLIWRLKGGEADSQIKYKFIRRYIEDSVYPENPSFKHVQHHNPKIPLDENLPYEQKLVLDGQQRLTAFYIGLNGTYTEKKKYAARKEASSWNEKKLYMNIFSDPDKEIGDELGLKYEFSFKKEQPEPTENAYWFPVSKIMELDPSQSAKNIIDSLGLEGFGKDKRWDASENISSLHSSINDDTRIQYHEETTERHERVLDIFIRTNDGGTPLKKSEILLSMATARWAEGEEQIDAREQITDLVDTLNERHVDKNFSFEIDFILKSLLVFSDLNPEYRISNFTNENLGEMKKRWQETGFKESLQKALDLVVEFGLDKRSLTSHNALIPIAYYIDRQDPSLEPDSSQGSENRSRIHYWLSSALLNGTFNSRPDEVLQDTREAIKGSDGGFPLQEIHSRMRGRGKVVGFSEEVVETLLEETTYRSQKSFLLLSMLYYPDPTRRGEKYQKDHIFPKSMLDADRLIEEHGFSPSEARKYEEARDRIANLQLITTNQEKSDEEFRSWLETRNDEYYDRHHIPKDEELYEIENFLEFVEERERLIKKHMQETFGQFD